MKTRAPPPLRDHLLKMQPPPGHGSSFSTDLAQTRHLSNSCSRAKNEAETFKPDSKGAQVSKGKSNMRPDKGLRKPRSLLSAGRAGLVGVRKVFPTPRLPENLAGHHSPFKLSALGLFRRLSLVIVNQVTYLELRLYCCD